LKEKNFVIVIMLVTLTLSVIVPQNIDVKASVDYGDPGINYGYVYNRTKDLSDIVFKLLSEDRGREFGEWGEQKAADYIEGWMENISRMDDVYRETIDAVYWENMYGVPSPYTLNKKKTFDKEGDDVKLEIKVMDGCHVIETRSIDCFPFFAWKTFDEESNVRVVEDLECCRIKQIVLVDADWRDPWKCLNGYWTKPFNPWRIRGWILVDGSNDSINTRFMGPSQLLDLYKPGYSINNSDGSWIRSYMEDGYEVFATIKSVFIRDYVESYNVIGEINGIDNDTYSIVCAHYDSWWNQGSIDEALETALVLGIAKFIDDRELNLTHNVKFIAFGGEEYKKRGSKDYVKDHNGENIKWVINPGNFGHGDKYYYDDEGNNVSLDFEIPSNNGIIENLTRKVTDHLQFTNRTGINVTINEAKLGAEDSKPFADNDACDGAVQFGRWPYRGYHRDGNSDGDNMETEHLEGDNMSRVDNETAKVECEVAASVALHLIVDTEHKFNSVNISSYSRDPDNESDSVKIDYNLTSDTNASIFGKVKGGLYNNSTGLCVTEKISDLFFLEKGEYVEGSMILSVNSTQPDGDYVVRMVVMNYWNEADDWYNETRSLNAYNLSSSSFSYLVQTIKTHNFIDNSLPAPGTTIIGWNWSFGDGNYSNSQNPNHTYYDNGTYSVSLNVTDSNNLTNITYVTIIVDNEPPSAVIDNIANVWCINDSLNFTSNCSDTDGSIVNWTWDFGDGNYSYTSNVTFNYSKSGFYPVTLTVTDDDNISNSTSMDLIVAGVIIDDSFQSDSPSTYRWKNIQSGVNNVSDGDIVYVKSGGYSEGVVVNRSIYLLSESKEDVTVNNTDGGIVFDLKDDSITLDNFTISQGVTCVLVNESDNCSIMNCQISEASYGIKITANAVNNTVKGCNLDSNSYGLFVSGSCNQIGSGEKDGLGNDTVFAKNTYGIYFDNSNDNVVLNCSINEDPKAGSFPSALYGICFDGSKNNTIIFCDIFNAKTIFSTGYGIYFDDSDNNHIYRCFIHENNCGVYLTSSSDNYLAVNNVSNNSVVGLSIYLPSSNNNTVNWNDFIGNGDGRGPQNSDNGVSSNWNSVNNETLYYVAGGEGNYWSDYSGSDGDGDGIGDTSYSMDKDSSDDYPVMDPYNFFN